MSSQPVQRVAVLSQFDQQIDALVKDGIEAAGAEPCERLRVSGGVDVVRLGLMVGNVIAATVYGSRRK